MRIVIAEKRTERARNIVSLRREISALGVTGPRTSLPCGLPAAILAPRPWATPESVVRGLHATSLLWGNRLRVTPMLSDNLPPIRAPWTKILVLWSCHDSHVNLQNDIFADHKISLPMLSIIIDPTPRILRCRETKFQPVLGITPVVVRRVWLGSLSTPLLGSRFTAAAPSRNSTVLIVHPHNLHDCVCVWYRCSPLDGS